VMEDGQVIHESIDIAEELSAFSEYSSPKG